MLYKICSTCKERYEYISRNSKCSNGCMDKNKKERNKNYDKFSRNKDSASFYATGQWKKLTKECREKFKGLDIYSYYINNEIVYGNLSHHIIELVEDKSKAYDLNNLIWLSDNSHTVVHTAYKCGEKIKMQKLLKNLIDMYEREFGWVGVVDNVFR